MVNPATKKTKKAPQAKKVQAEEFDFSNENSSSEMNGCGAKTKKVSTTERVGDWTCQRCFNHNFSFREVCNMCYLSHIESNKMLYQVQQTRFMAAQMQPPMMSQPSQFSASMRQ